MKSSKAPSAPGAGGGVSSGKNRGGGRREEVRADERGGMVGSNGESGGAAGADRGSSAGISSRGGGSVNDVGRNNQSPEQGDLDRSSMRVDGSPAMGYIPIGAHKDLREVTYDNMVTVVSRDGKSTLSASELFTEILSKVLSKEALASMKSITPVGWGRWLVKFGDNFQTAAQVKVGDTATTDGRIFTIYEGQASFGMQHISHVTKTIRIKGLPPALKFSDISKKLLIDPANIEGLQVVESGMELYRFPQ